MTNRVKPIVPMSIYDHDKEVMEAWNDAKISESPIQLILDNLGPVLKQYFINYSLNKSIDLCSNILCLMFKIKDREYFTLKIFDDPEIGYQVDERINSSGSIKYYKTLDEAKEEMINFIKPYLPEELKTEDYTCEFCADGTDEYGKSLFREELKLGNAAIADVDVYIGSEDNMEMLITNSTDEVIAKQVMKIKYCPMCGRKLGGTE